MFSKKILCLIIIFISFSSVAQDLKPPNEGKAIVYFTRVSSVGFLINFKYFDGDQYLGKFNHGKYLAYECEPGKHLFWAKSENIDYLEAELEAGKIYIIDSEPQMGAFKAGVKLVPYDRDPSHYKNQKKYEQKRKDIIEAITQQTEYISSGEAMEESQKDMEDLIRRGTEKYNKKKSEGAAIKVLTPEMDFQKDN
jgi:hypothetical protein